MEEIWRPIKNYEGIYEISNYGRVKSLARKGTYERILNQRINKGYCSVILYKNGISKVHTIHRLVAENFLKNSNNYPVVMHKDNNKANNCVDNLKWGTYKENTQQAQKDGLMKQPNYWQGKTGKKHASAKKVMMFDINGNYLRTFDCIRDALKFIGKSIKSPNITTCCKKITNTAYGYKWRYVDDR